MSKVVIYARYSSDMQRSESLDAQIRICKMHISQNKWDLVETYKDAAVSGKTDNRPAFQRMIQDAKAGLFDVVLVHKLDRFSRDGADTLVYAKRLDKYGVRLESVAEPFNGQDTPESALMRMVSIGMNEYYVKNLAREVKKGLFENAYHCMTTGGKPAYGYDLEDKKYVINPHEAEGIAKIFTMYAAGNSYVDIIRELNAQGFRTKKGNEWGKNSLYEILRNPKYYGLYVYNRSKTSGNNGKRSPHHHNPVENQIQIENGVPAIVSKELWDSVQERLDRNKRTAGRYKAKREYLLSGLVHCGLCKGAYQGNTRKPAKNRDYFSSYRCGRKGRKGAEACTNREIQRDELEGYVLEQIAHAFFKPEVVPALTKAINQYIATESQDSVINIKRLTANKNRLLKQRENIVNAIAKGGFNDIFTGKLKVLEQQLAEVNEQLLQEDYKQSPEPVTEKMVRDIMRQWKSYLQSKNTKQLREVVVAYVKSVDIYPDDIVLTLKIPMPNERMQEALVKFELKTQVNRECLKTAS